MFWRIYIGLLLLVIGTTHIKPAEALASGGHTPVLQKITDIVPSDRIPPYSNKDCQPQVTFITKPARLSSGQAEQRVETCAVATAFGLQSASDTTIALAGSRLAGPVVAQSGSRLTGQAIPSSKHFLFHGSGTYGSKQYLVKNFAEHSNPIIEPSGAVRHQISASASITPIVSAMGTALEFADVRFSSNGEWLVGDVPFQGLTRVNIETGQTVTFGDPYNYNIGVRPHYVLSISSDGRYVFATAAGYDLLKVYDLASCSPVNLLRSTCASADLLAFTRSSLPGFQNVHHAQFSTNKTIRLFLNYSSKTGYFLLKLDGTDESKLDYLALGDSFTSGEGIFDYRVGTDVKQPFNKCHLSDFSYPFLLQQSQQFNRTESVACSGAKIKDIYFSDSNKNYRSDGRQSHGKENHLYDSEIYTNFLTGYREQIDFVNQYKPRVVTISIGGNDIGFGHIIAKCLAPGTCYSDPTQKTDLLNTITGKKDQVAMLFRQVKQAAATNAFIYTLGYPNLANPAGSCGLNVRLDKTELEFGNMIVNHLNEVIRQAAQMAQVQYIDVTQALQGHRLCENTGDQLAINGLTAGDDKTLTLAVNDLAWSIDFYLSGRESYHPTRLGHQLYAKRINQALAQSLPPPPDTQHIASLGAVASRQVIFDNSLSPSMSLRGSQVAIHASNVHITTDVQLHLDDLALPFVAQSTAGNKFVAFTHIPNSVTPGIYSLRLQTKNIVGEPVEIQKVIYVADSADDIDGDNISNTSELCLLVEPAYIDADYDYIDDACDGQISSFAPPLLRKALSSSLTEPASHGQPFALLPISTTPAIFRETAFRPLTNIPGAHQSQVASASSEAVSRTSRGWIVIMVLIILMYGWSRSSRKHRKHLQ